MGDTVDLPILCLLSSLSQTAPHRNLGPNCEQWKRRSSSSGGGGGGGRRRRRGRVVGGSFFFLFLGFLLPFLGKKSIHISLISFCLLLASFFWVLFLTSVFFFLHFWGFFFCSLVLVCGGWRGLGWLVFFFPFLSFLSSQFDHQQLKDH